ncbi:DNA/RNA non-specific endonuclease [Snuella sedimenti]|uniref:Endonuclease n=1 Tax=Snuella sedimenti TaxID=2798802 RepID=A0A8J7IUD9_9FLAO|nr:DNA/RNA non-specific endonuclease [Snuella sedimenti]MBJ6366820.1 DNA/RNA non-specific endonuclease [Snuella sedimenti]
MNKRTLYSILAALIFLGVYSYEYFLNEGEKVADVSEGQVVKANTKEYLLPTSTTEQVIHHEGYSLSYSEPYEQPEWVAYQLKKSDLSKANYKRPYFEIDKAVITGAAHWNNYKNSGYDRGHLCPAGDRRYSQSAYEETFLTSNITPQEHRFNSGIWNDLEQQVRYWASKYNDVFVVTGGVLKDGLEVIGKEQVAVPDYFFKVLLATQNGKTNMIAFLMPHKDSDIPLYEFVVPVDEIEKLTGIDFFFQLDDELEYKLETSSNTTSWDFYE